MNVDSECQYDLLDRLDYVLLAVDSVWDECVQTQVGYLDAAVCIGDDPNNTLADC